MLERMFWTCINFSRRAWCSDFIERIFRKVAVLSGDKGDLNDGFTNVSNKLDV